MRNHAQIRRWNQPVLSYEDNVSCSRKQLDPLMGLEPKTGRLWVRCAQWNNWSLWWGSNQRLTDYESDALHTTPMTMQTEHWFFLFNEQYTNRTKSVRVYELLTIVHSLLRQHYKMPFVFASVLWYKTHQLFQFLCQCQSFLGNNGQYHMISVIKTSVDGWPSFPASRRDTCTIWGVCCSSGVFFVKSFVYWKKRIFLT